jgi:membrane-associated phospholipid phosphatase
MVSETQGWPWLAPWNFDALRFLFKLTPHTNLGIRLATFLLQNPLMTTWVFAAVSYAFWAKQDDRTAERRIYLLRIVAASVLSFGLTALLDVKIGWASPARTMGFQSLFPSYLWGTGSSNSFPSHSTMVYLIVSLGLLRLNKVAGLLLVPFTFLIISFPRVYVGGHHPIDIAGSILLAVLSFAGIDLLLTNRRVTDSFSWAATHGQDSEVFFFLWLYELADGFRSAEDTVHFVFRLVRAFRR